MKKIITILLLSSALSVFAQQKSHTVQKSETLYSISKQYNVSVDQIKEWNNLSSNDLSLRQEIIVSQPTKASNQTSKHHVVASGETLYSISKKYNVTVEQLKTLNTLSSESLSLGQKLIISGSKKEDTDKEAVHTVSSGETLYSISQDHSMTVEELIKRNKLESNALSIGQKLIVTGAPLKQEEEQSVAENNKTISEQAKRDIIHTVRPKETLFSISRIYGVPVSDIKKLNKMTTYEISIGQKLVIQDRKSNGSSLEKAEPTYLNKEIGAATLRVNSTIAHKKYSYCLHKTLKVGTVVKITNTDSNEFIYARIMGNLGSSDKALVAINQTIADKISNGLSTFPASIEYVK